MAVIKPFKAYRPPSNIANTLSSKPYDIVTYEEVKSTLSKNPLSFLGVTRSEGLMDESISPYDPNVYRLARENYNEMLKEKKLLQDPETSFYIYEQTLGNHTQKGLVCLTSVEDYVNDIIKKHEKTREDKENDRTRHIDILNSQLEPVFLTYKPDNEVNSIINQFSNDASPDFDFISNDNVHQKLWKITDTNTLNRLIVLFDKIEYLYIADGHHRAASAAKIGIQRKNANASHNGEEEYNFILSVLFPSDSLFLLPYHRALKSLNNLSPEEFLNKLNENFIIKKLSSSPSSYPESKRHFYLYILSEWHELTLKEGLRTTEDPVLSLDVSILQDLVFDAILGIKDPKTDKRLDFIGGLDAMNRLKMLVDEKKAVASFALFPTSIESLMSVADKNMLMPPKSTWFEPKLRSGLFIHALE